MEEQQQFYIVLKEEAEDTYGTVPGSIWKLESQITKNIVLLSQFEGQEIGRLKQFNISNVLHIDNITANLLLAIHSSEQQRLQVILDESWILEGTTTINVGSKVEIQQVPGLPKGATGTVRFKGRLPGKHGISFGVELDPEFSGKGTTDGTFRHEKLFKCDEDCGLFLSIYRIRAMQSITSDRRICLDLKTEVDGASNVVCNRNYLSNQKAELALADESSLKVNERIVWMSDYGPEFGTVKWTGTLPYSANGQSYVGVEFDNPVGSGTGKYKGNQLFKAKRNHASLVPLLGLLRASVYMSMRSSDLDMSIENTLTDYYQDFKISNFIEVNTDMMKNKVKVEDSSLDRMDKINNTHSSNCDKSNNAVKELSSLNEVKTSDASPQHSEVVKKCTLGPSPYSLQTGDRVSIRLDKLRRGVIRWTGYLQSNNKPDQLIAGIEMDETDEKYYTAGMFRGENIFECPPNRGFFIPLDKCEINV